MSRNSSLLFRQTYKDERGQVLPIVAFMMVTFLGLAGLVVDVGHVYFSYQLLQNATNAAALAGAQGLPYNTSTTNQAQINVMAYSSKAGSKNAYGNLNVTNTTYSLKCLGSGTIGASIPCVSTGVGSNTANAIQVVQTASVPTTFMRLFGFSSISLSATGSALMAGAAHAPYNVAIILDTTSSMNTTDTNCGSKTRLACAQAGIQTLLQGLSPCAANGSGCVSLDRVSLFTFPNMKTGTVSKDYTCPTSNPTIGPYVFPTNSITYNTGTTIGTTGYTYQITPFQNNYRTSNSATSLNASSYSVIAVGKGSCSGVKAPGGAGTYYAGAIYQAQAALAAAQYANQNSQNVMILISDGDASSTNMSSKGINGSGTINTNGLYPSAKDQCWQAVTAAQYATSQGTKVYAIAYGSETAGCSTDTLAIAGTADPYTTPCYAMQNIASSAATFYSDYTQSGTGVDKNCKAGNSVSTLNDIFTQIASNLSVSRLIPNSAFPSS